MSLDRKLSAITENLDNQEAEKKKSTQDQELKPVRARVKALEMQKHQLGLIKGSLELKSGKDTGVGMKEYAAETEQQMAKESISLDVAMDKNKRALEAMGIKDRDQLVAHPEFVEEPEAVSYKKAKKRGGELRSDDASLQKRLQDLGVIINLEAFSYEAAEKAIAEKLKSIEEELIAEKLKTPEGREQIIEMLAQSLFKKIPAIQFNKDERSDNGEFFFGYSKALKISIAHGRADFSSSRYFQWLPDNLPAVEAAYEPDIVQAALRKAYQLKISEAIALFDKKNQDVFSLRQQIESISPAEAREVRTMAREFSQLGNLFRSVVGQKIEELKKGGIELDPDRLNFTWRGSTEENLTSLIDGEKGIGGLENLLVDTFPGYDFKKLQKGIASRIEALKQLIKAVEDIENEKDIEAFVESGGPLLKAHDNQLRTRSIFLNDSFFELKGEKEWGSETSGKEMLLKKFKGKTYAEVARYLDGKIEEFNQLKQKVLEAVEVGLALDAKKKELVRAAQTEGFVGDRESFPNVVTRIKDVENRKSAARRAIAEIEELKKKLPAGENLILADGRIKVPSIGIRAGQLEREKEKEAENLIILNKKISEHRGNEPKLFGKTKWQKDLENLYKDAERLNNKITAINAELGNLLRQDTVFPIPEILGRDQAIEGSASEILNSLRTQLNEMTQAKVSESVARLYAECQELESKLSGRGV